MTEETLPSDWEELGELIASGEMTEAQVSQVLEEHGHSRFTCEGCKTIREMHDETPMELVFSAYGDSLTLEQRRVFYENFAGHIHPEDGWAWQYVKGTLMEVACGGSADRDLLLRAASDYDSFVEHFRAEPGDDSLETRTRDFAAMFAENKECDEKVIRDLVEKYHLSNPSGDCSGLFDACDTCISIIEDTAIKLR